MKIGLIIYGSPDTMSGGYLYDRKLVEYLGGQGDTVRIISLPGRSYGRHLLDNLTFHLPGGFDLLIQDELNHPSLLAANAGRHACPVIGLVHNLRSAEPRRAWQNDLYRRIERLYLNSLDGLIFNSHTTQAAVRGLLVADKPALVATPGGDRLGSAAAGVLRARAAEPGPLRIIFLANVTPLKGLHVLLQALHQAGAGFTLQVIGSLDVDTAYARWMQALVHAWHLDGAVRFHGILDGAELAAELRRAHVLAVPSSYEGFGIAYLEGMAFGLPAIATTGGAAHETIQDGVNGYLIQPGDSATLAARLSELGRDRPLLANMASQARRKFESQPTWIQSGGRIRAFLQEMVAP
jgi:glycosyltransferase involved in cell wall biosynthesis